MPPDTRNGPPGCITTPRGRSEDQIIKATTPTICAEDSAATRQHDAAEQGIVAAVLAVARRIAAGRGRCLT